MTRSRAAMAAAAALVWAGAVRADETSELDELLSESIVSTPSRSSETATTAPATSSIVTAEDLRTYGIRSLDEAINFLALGMVTSAPLHAVEIGARGVMLTSDYGNHVLVLLDQHILNEPWNGSAYFDRGLAVPIELIDHIEVILGPGSVLYGSQAMLGVIHVVTKRAADRSGPALVMEGEVALPTRRSGDLIAPSLSSEYRSRLGPGYRLGASYGAEFRALGAAGDVMLGLEYYRHDGPSFELGPQPYGDDAVTGAPKNFGPRAVPGVWGGVTRDQYATEVASAVGRVTLGSWFFAARAASYHRLTPYLDSNINVSGDFDDPDNRERDRWLNLELGVRQTLTEIVDLSLRAYGDIYDYHWRNESSAAEDCFGGVPLGCTQYLLGKAGTLGADAQVRFSWLPELRLETLFGVDGKQRFIRSDYDVVNLETGEPLPIENDHRRTDTALAVYAQQSVSPSSWLDLNVGARFDYDERSGSALSPRSAAGITPWAGGRLKLIYSQAFRAPSAYELGYADYTTQIPADDLDAETVRSIEASIEHRFGAHRVMFGGFRSWWDGMVAYGLIDADTLSRAQAQGLLDPTITEAYEYTNVARIDNYGYNASFEGGQLQQRLRYALNVTHAYSRQDPRDGSERQPLTVGPDRARRSRAVLPRQHCQQLFLAVTGDAGHAQDLPAVQRERDVAQGDPEAVALLDAELVHHQASVARLARLALHARGLVAQHQASERRGRLAAWVHRAHDAAGAQHRRAVTEGPDFIQLVADVEDRAARGRQPPRGREQGLDGLRRQHAGGLVQDEQARPREQRAQELHALALAHGQIVNDALGVERQPVLVGHSPERRPHLVQRTAARFAPIDPEPDVLRHRQALEQREVLEDHGDAQGARRAGPVRLERLALPAQLARVGAQHAVDDLHQRRLAGAILAEHGVNLAGAHPQRHAIVGHDAPGIALRHVDQLEPVHPAVCRRHGVGRERPASAWPDVAAVSSNATRHRASAAERREHDSMLFVARRSSRPAASVSRVGLLGPGARSARHVVDAAAPGRGPAAVAVRPRAIQAGIAVVDARIIPGGVDPIIRVPGSRAAHVDGAQKRRLARMHALADDAPGDAEAGQVRRPYAARQGERDVDPPRLSGGHHGIAADVRGGAATGRSIALRHLFQIQLLRVETDGSVTMDLELEAHAHGRSWVSVGGVARRPRRPQLDVGERLPALHDWILGSGVVSARAVARHVLGGQKCTARDTAREAHQRGDNQSEPRHPPERR
jgi:outer membrane receptor for ferrienterochelin and colicins